MALQQVIKEEPTSSLIMVDFQETKAIDCVMKKMTLIMMPTVNERRVGIVDI